MSRKKQQDEGDRRPYDSFRSSFSHHHPHASYGKVFSIAVVGLSGTEKDKGCLGVGKSCLCNRFVRPQADEYNKDHISVLSQTDFSGPIVNNEHWLYWGETRKATEEGFELTFSVVEQTEFVDDACFTPFRSGKMEPYYKRCAATKLSSAEKLMYVCKNQLGVEKEYEQHYLPDGRFNVDGFVCVFDVSEIQGREISRQIELTALILSTLLKTKKPVILATTKNDEVYHPYMREAERLVGRREFKGLIPLVETSAHDSVNVDLAFWACVQRDWTKGKTKLLSYQESFQRQRDRLEIVNDNYLSLIRSQITDYRTHWNNTYSNLAASHDFLAYCDLFGEESAQQTFKRHVKKLRDDYVCRKMQMYLRVLPKVLAALLPDLDAFGPDQSWPAVQRTLQAHPLFEAHFVVNCDGAGSSWQEMDHNAAEASGETRIPFDLLSTGEAEKAFVDHREALRAEEHLRSLRHQFGELLRETSIEPGQPLKEVRLLLAGRECVESLAEPELALIYEDYQRLLAERAREQLTELFLERAALFLTYTQTGQMVTQEDLAAIAEKLAEDERWRALELLPQDRHLALIRYLGFMQWPIKEHCPAAYTGCVDVHTEAFVGGLAKRGVHSRSLWGQEQELRVKLKVVGSSGLAENLANVVKAMRSTLEQENPRVLLDVQVANDLLESSTRGTFSSGGEAEAYVCVYSNRSSLEVVRKSLEQSLLTDLAFGNPHHHLGSAGGAGSVLGGLPLVLLLATSPAALESTSAKERAYLREEGQARAAALQCAFFDVTSDEPHARFKSDELLRALLYLSEGVVRRADLLQHESSLMNYSPSSSLPRRPSSTTLIPEGALNPEIRILLCLMCGDPILPGHFLELLLLPHSLPQSALYPVSKHSVVADVGVLLALDEDSEESPLEAASLPSRYVEFVLTSYHSAHQFKEELVHGYICVYWSKRQASFANMSALASTVVPLTPIQILALVENESRPSKLSHQLVADGQAIAQTLNANFRVSTMSHHMGRCISTFLNYALTNRLQIEKGFQMTAAAVAAAQQQQQHSPNSTANDDECYDPSTDPSFAPLLAAQLVNTQGGQGLPIHHRRTSSSDLMASADSSIYERLPGDHQGGEPKMGYQHGLPNPHHSLVRRAAPAPAARSAEGEGGADSPSSFFTSSAYESGAGGTSTAQEEQLVKPSQIKQRRRQNYYNLQSYPSADSLDRVVYPLDHTGGNYQQHYYANLAQPLPHPLHHQSQSHYRSTSPSSSLYRNEAENRLAFEAHSQGPSYGGHHAFLDDNHHHQNLQHHFQHFQHHPQHHFQHAHHPQHDLLPPRPASSAHVMIPPPNEELQPHQPPPYSRVAVSPPPAYKMGGSSYGGDGVLHGGYGTAGVNYRNEPGFYGGPGTSGYLEDFDAVGNPHGFYGNTLDQHPGHSGQRKLYGAPPQVPPFRTYSPPFDSAYSSESQNFHHLGHQSLLRGHAHPDQFTPTTSSYRHSPLLYATTSRSHHARSSHFHQLGRTAFYGDPQINLQDQENLGISPYGPRSLSSHTRTHHTASSSAHAKEKTKKKKKKTHSSSKTSRSSSAAKVHYRRSHQSSSAMDDNKDVDGDVDDGDDDDEDDETSEDEDEAGQEGAEKNKAKILRKKKELKKRVTERPASASAVSRLDEPKGPDLVAEKSDNGKTADEQKKSTNKTAKVDSDTDSEVGENDDENDESCLEPEELGEEEEEVEEVVEAEEEEEEDTVSSSNNSAGDNLIAAPSSLAVDRYAVSSGWAYHQSGNNNNSNGNATANHQRHPLTEQWPPPGAQQGQFHGQPEAEPETGSLERGFKAPGKLDLNRFNNLSNAIGRLTLNSPGPLGPTRAAPAIPFSSSSFDNSSDYRPNSRQKNHLDFTPEQLNMIATMGNSRRGRGGPGTVAAAAAAAVASKKGQQQNFIASGKGDSNSEKKQQVLKSKSIGAFAELDNNVNNSVNNLDKKASRKAEKLEKKRQKEEERKSRKASKEAGARNRSRSKSTTNAANSLAGNQSPGLEAFAQSNGNAVPLFIEKCTRFIEQEGLDMEGIYRVPGNRAHVDTLLQQFDENPDINITDLDIPVNAVATALKDFFMKRLPPIFPADCMEDIAALSRQYTDTGVLADMRTFLHRLPPPNYAIIHFMIAHFAKVVEKSSINSMDSKNLAICWWPTLLQFEFSDMFVFEQARPHLMNFVQIMIDSLSELFTRGSRNLVANSSEELSNTTNLSYSADELVSL